MERLFQPRLFAATLLIGLLSLPSGVLAQNSNKQVWCMKTDKGKYIEMSRVQKLTDVDKQGLFKVAVSQGQAASGVESVTFEKHKPGVMGDADGNGYVDKEDVLVIVNYIMGKKADTFNFDGADTNGDNKVNVTDLVAVVNIIKTTAAGARGISTSFGEQLSVSDDEPGRIDPGTIPQDPQDDSEGLQYEMWPIELLPGTIVNLPDNRNVPTPQVVTQEPITIEPEPVRIIPQQVEPPTNLGSVPYFRVQFTENLLEVKKYAGGSSSDNFTFFNPAYDYLDFKYPLPFTDSNISGDPASDYFYYIGNTPKDRTRFAVAKTDGSLAIKKIWVHNQPVQFINVSSDELSDVIDGQRTITYTFNALPRNMEELKTLEVNDREYFKSPHFVTALFICCLNRITDNSSDAWHMINYLRTHTATVGENNIFKVSNVAMQGIAQRLMEKDPNGFPVSNGLRSYFAGSSPGNQYTPTEPYQVTVVEKVSNVYTTEDGFLCAKLYVKSSGSKNLIGPLKLRKVEGHDWMVYSGEEVFTKQMDPQE